MKICERCEKPKKRGAVRDTAPYTGGWVCTTCDKELASGTVPPEPIDDADGRVVPRSEIEGVIQRIRGDVERDGVSSITWRTGAEWALRQLEDALGIERK